MLIVFPPCLSFVDFVLWGLFQEVVEIARNLFVQMHAVGTHHVVPIARVGEEVGMRVGIDASADERQAVLRNAGWVIAAIDNEEATFQLVCLVEA